MLNVKGYAAKSASSVLEPFSFQRRDLRDDDIQIEIQYCGVCHSDIHQARDEWGGAVYPMVPGHEIVGVVQHVGKNVKTFKPGDRAGVGCFINSCRTCSSCQQGLEQYCETGFNPTYNGADRDGSPTYGGYSTAIVVDQKYTLQIPTNLELSGVAPLLCAGITTFSPLRQWKVGRGQRVGIVGLGGLGHMGVKFAASFGAEVTVLSTSRNKETDARRLGASDFIVTREPKELESAKGKFDFILNTVSAPHDLNGLMDLLKRDGTMVVVGVPPETTQIHAFNFIMKRRRLAGSLIGGIAETQEMLDYCGKNGIVSDVEKIAMKDINTAYERMIKGDVRYRFVIDTATV